MIDEQRFLAESARVGIAPEHARALYARLFPTAAEPTVQTDVTLLSHPTEPFAARSTLSRLVQVFVWVGVLLVMGAHAWWATIGFEDIGAGFVLGLTLLWQGLFVGAAIVARRRSYRSLMGGFAAIVIAYTPLSVYCALRLTGADFDHDNFHGFYEWVSGSWVVMEVVTLVVAGVMLALFTHPFLAFPTCLTVAFLFMDGAASAFGDASSDEIGGVVLFGAALLIAMGIALDYMGLRRFAFWPHLSGIYLAAWGLSDLLDDATAGLLIAAVIAAGLGIWLARITYIVTGALFLACGISAAGDGAMIPFLLLPSGLAFIALAVWISKRDSSLRRWLAARSLPAPQRDLQY